jgi:alkanesulfonate monooxygenase SsuD/methylene tetrahydromethanopterin reductase-like flavin-dependent oxidoreductase (luciferase family)
MWIAGGGEQLTLNVAARYADYTNFGYTLDEFTHKSHVLAGHCEDVGRDFDEIVRTTNFNIVIGETEAEVADRTAWVKEHFTPVVGADKVDEMFSNNYVKGGGIAGTPDQIVEHLRTWQAAGMTYGILYFQDLAYDRRGLDLFTEKVVPRLQGV